jgi:hypothetical protein
MALMPTERMGPPPGALPPMRMTASWSGSDRTYRIQVGGAKMRLNGKLPSNHHSDRRRQTLELRRKARLPVHPPSACSGLKALRNTSLAKAASRQAALAFRSLDPFRALREPDPRRRDEERPSRSEQRTLSKAKKHYLTGKAPYKFESTSLQRGVCCERHFRGAFHRRTEGWNPARSKLLRSGCGKRTIWSTELRDLARLGDAG